MIFKDPFLSIIIVFIVPPLVLGLRYIAKRLRETTREAVILNSRVLGAMQETLQGIAIVKAFTMEKPLEQRIFKTIDEAERRGNKIARLTERTAPLTETIAGIAVSSVLAYAAYRAIYNNVPPGAFFAFVTALLLAYDPARRLARLQVSMERAVVNARMIYEILDMEPVQREKPNAVPLKIENATVELRNVVFLLQGFRSYPQRRELCCRRRKDDRPRRTLGSRKVHDHQPRAKVLRSDRRRDFD